MAGTVDINDNSQQVLKSFHEKIQLALKLIGEEAEGFAKKNCPVDTGRLRNSITYATSEAQGEPNTNKHPKGQTDAKPSDYTMHGTPEENAVYIGTNVEYAPAVEFLSRQHKVGRAHFLKDAATSHSARYKKIAETVLKSK